MNLSPNGLAACGNAGSGVWVNGRQLFGPTAGFPAWLDATTLVYNGASGQLRACAPDGSSDRFVAMEGGAPVLAGGGRWATFTTARGIRTSDGLSLPDAAPVTMAPDGTLFVTTYQNPSDIRAYRPDASDPAYTLVGASPMLNLGTTGANARALDGQRLVWVDQSLKIRARGFGSLRPAQVDEPAREVTVLEPMPGVYWLAYTTQSGRNVLHPFADASRGYVAGVGGYGFTGWCQSPGVIETCSANNLGEIGPIARRQFIAADPVDLEIIPPPVSIEFPVIAEFARAISLAPFKDLAGESGADSEVVIDGAVQAASRPCWVGFDLDGGTTAIDRAHALGRLVGIAAEGFGARGFDAARRKADALQTRIAWWSDGPELVTPPSSLETCDQVWDEWYVYRERGETLAQALDRWRRAWDLALASRCHDLGGIPQFFDRGLFSEQETVDIIGAGVNAFRDDPRLLVLGPFEFARINGITGKAAIRQTYNLLHEALTRGVPTFTPIGRPVPRPTPLPSPVPAPTPAPVHVLQLFPKVTPMAVTANARLKWNDLLVGCCPTPLAEHEGDAAFPVLIKQPDGSYYPPRPDSLKWDDSWADAVITVHDDGDDALLTAANRQISFCDAFDPTHAKTVDSLQTRAAGTIGGWEKPNGGTDPQGHTILYRAASGMVLTVEVRP